MRLCPGLHPRALEQPKNCREDDGSGTDGDMAAIVDADTAFHGIIVVAGGSLAVTELWHISTGRWVR